jgi:hypothetical protein
VALIHDEARARAVAQAGLALVRERYSWAGVTRALLDDLETLRACSGAQGS